MTFTLRWLGFIQPTKLPFSEILKFVIFANFSIVGMNVSLMWNSVGFYQVSKGSFLSFVFFCFFMEHNSLFTLAPYSNVFASSAFQIAKLSMIPVSCLLEVVFDSVRYSRDTKLSIVLVLLGVAVCTVTDLSVNAKGFISALVAVWSTALQQYVSSENFRFFLVFA